FSAPLLVVTNREAARAVSVNQRCTPGLGRARALTTCRLSGSQLNAAASSGRSATGEGTTRGTASPIGRSQNSVRWPKEPLAQTPSFEPSGEKWTLASVKPCRSLKGGRVYSTGGDPGGDDNHNLRLRRRCCGSVSEFLKNA